MLLVITLKLSFVILTCRLLDADQEHTASLSGAVAVVRQEESKRIQDAVEATRLEERVCVRVAGEKLAVCYFVCMKGEGK